MSTPTDFVDEVALPDFEDALWSALRDEAAAPERPAPRRAWPVAAAVLVVVVLAGAVLLARSGDESGSTVVGATATSGEETTVPEPPVTLPDGAVVGEPDPPAPPPTEEALSAAEAIRQAADTTIQLTETTTDGVVTRRFWGDHVSGGTRGVTYRGDGTPKFELGLAEPPPPTGALVDPLVRSVDHCFDEWSEGAGPIVGGALLGHADLLEEGRLVVDGPEVVDGRTLLGTHHVVLSWQVDPETGEPIGHRWVDDDLPGGLYLDPDTLLPALEVSSLGYPDGERTTFTYLDRSDPASRATLVAPVPDGSTRVDRVRTDQERVEALCW